MCCGMLGLMIVRPTVSIHYIVCGTLSPSPTSSHKESAGYGEWIRTDVKFMGDLFCFFSASRAPIPTYTSPSESSGNSEWTYSVMHV